MPPPSGQGAAIVPEPPWWLTLSRSTRTTGRPVVQAAADGRWETARELTIAGRADASHEALDGVVQAADDDVAIEVLWPGQAFVGVRWRSDETSAVDVALDRLRTVLHPPDSAADAWPVETALLALLGTVPSADLELAELGAVNAWASTGPEVLWQRGHGPGEPDLDNLLARRPDLTACSRPVAVELAVTLPRPSWIGIAVSTSGTEPVHRLDRRLLDDVLDRVL